MLALSGPLVRLYRQAGKNYGGATALGQVGIASGGVLVMCNKRCTSRRVTTVAKPLQD